jgi:hypothetical protein
MRCLDAMKKLVETGEVQGIVVMGARFDRNHVPLAFLTSVSRIAEYHAFAFTGGLELLREHIGEAIPDLPDTESDEETS